MSDYAPFVLVAIDNHGEPYICGRPVRFLAQKGEPIVEPVKMRLSRYQEMRKNWDDGQPAMQGVTERAVAEAVAEAVASERERCARVCEEEAANASAASLPGHALVLEDAARRIRREPAK